MDEWLTRILLKDIPRLSILKLFNVVAIYANNFFPVNIEQCSLLGFPCVSADSSIPFYYWKYLGGSFAIIGHINITHNIFSCFIFLLFKDFSIIFSLFVNSKQTSIFFDCWLILFKYLLQLDALK